MTHTPGQWTVIDNCSAVTEYHFYACVHGHGLHIAPIAGGTGADEANAALIVAAPELLEACRDAANQLRTIAALLNHIPKRYAAHIIPTIRYGDIDAVISKAEAQR